LDRSEETALSAGQELPELAPHGRRLREGYLASYGGAKFPATPHSLHQYPPIAASSLFGNGQLCGDDG